MDDVGKIDSHRFMVTRERSLLDGVDKYSEQFADDELNVDKSIDCDTPEVKFSRKTAQDDGGEGGQAGC